MESPIASRRSSSVHPHDIFSTPNNRRFTTTSSTEYSSLPTPPLRSNAEMLRGNVMIPNVRDEISGLREEIERLRSVVGGLAQELGGGAERVGGARIEEERGEEGMDIQENGVGEAEDDYDEREGEVEDEGIRNGRNEEDGVQGGVVEGETPSIASKVDLDETSSSHVSKDQVELNGQPNGHGGESKSEVTIDDEPVLSEAILKTAHISANIIRLLDGTVNTGEPADESNEKIKARSDEDIFGKANLEKIEAYIKDLGGK
ncbi:hypothetical protein I302_109102 [Kwoniella bestiolae CBS 10118]|uniref:Uncharacterized protein n=1 Tax=Kwoniella bestiolae CBS 10118 TaxID=1296100 RepID=A0A1B9FUZ9_9TREE|nr:hypothetical protein I302_08247 [Kwoniella bestiolae CBS 10118]OCF22597.1 hypothetical protein I302_08247 [Kwoniella bestiolae CBS 10118]